MDEVIPSRAARRMSTVSPPPRIEIYTEFRSTVLGNQELLRDWIDTIDESAGTDANRRASYNSLVAAPGLLAVPGLSDRGILITVYIC